MFVLMTDDVGKDSEHSEAPEADQRSTRRGGAMLAAAMLGLDIALGRKPREEIPIVVDANGDPVDIDGEGIVVPIDDHANAVTPPLPRRPPTPELRRKRRAR